MKDILEGLVKLAGHLDSKGFVQEADMADTIAKSIHAEMLKELSAPAKPGAPAKPEDAKPGTSGDEEEESEEENMAPIGMKMDDESCMQQAAANLKQVQMRRRARQRKLLVDKV